MPDVTTDPGTATPFRILALSGGGIRGYFQACLLRKIEEEILKGPLAEHVEFVAGTSTGSISAAAIASGIPIARVVELFRTTGSEIFTKNQRWFGGFSGVPKYSSQRLRSELQRVLGNRTFGDGTLESHLLITSVDIDVFRHVIFCSLAGNEFSAEVNSHASLVDAVICSCAAPTYFPMGRAVGVNAGLVDGGLWANDPSLVALAIAKTREASIHNAFSVVTIGTGLPPRGGSSLSYENFTDIDHATHTIDLMFATQESSMCAVLGCLMPKGNYLALNAPLPRRIALDDVTTSLALLPAIADGCFAQNRAAIERFFEH